MAEQIKQIIIDKEDAVFWMDASGCWCNAGGKFRKKKIIDLFHRSIAKDDGGYFVSQTKEGVLEKVYFRYEDTALFVFAVEVNNDIILQLNTEEQMKLNPSDLYIKDDNLYIKWKGERIKFAERALIRISSFIEEDGDRLMINVNGHRYPIPETDG